MIVQFISMPLTNVIIRNSMFWQRCGGWNKVIYFKWSLCVQTPRGKAEIWYLPEWQCTIVLLSCDLLLPTIIIVFISFQIIKPLILIVITATVSTALSHLFQVRVCVCVILNLFLYSSSYDKLGSFTSFRLYIFKHPDASQNVLDLLFEWFLFSSLKKLTKFLKLIWISCSPGVLFVKD